MDTKAPLPQPRPPSWYEEEDVSQHPDAIEARLRECLTEEWKEREVWLEDKFE